VQSRANHLKTRARGAAGTSRLLSRCRLSLLFTAWAKKHIKDNNHKYKKQRVATLVYNWTEAATMPDDTDSGPPRPAADAVSLHTIANHDVYATQEQEDADFALALSLEEEEQDRAREVSQLTVQAQEREALIPRERLGSDAIPPPYRDDSDDSDDDAIPSNDLPPYRDDPDADERDGNGNVEAQAPQALVEERRFQRSLHRSGNLLRDFARGFGSRNMICRNLSRLAVTAILVIVLLLVLGILLIGPLFYYLHEPTVTKKQRAFDVSGSMDINLKITKLYPPLEDGTSENCARTWNAAAAGLHCHKDILSTAWDKGDAEYMEKSRMNIWESSRQVCGGFVACGRNIRVLREKVFAECTRRTDRFDFDKYGTYKLRFFETNELDDGPVQAVQALEARYNHLCDSEWNEKLPWNTYSGELWMMWGIADGKDAKQDIRYLDIFLDATNEKNTIEAHTERGSVETWTGPLSYEVEVPARKVGPGDAETVCGNSIRAWLGRKWRNFEYGAVLESHTGIPLGLAQFNELMARATKRCAETSLMIKWSHYLWEDYGWWCKDKDAPCHEDEPVPRSVTQLLHGLGKNHSLLSSLRDLMKRKGAPKDALEGLHDSLLSMPCSIFIPGDVMMKHVMPSDYRVHRLCGNECRNAVDRIQRKYSDLFEEPFAARWSTNILLDWNPYRASQNLTCKGPEYNDLITEKTPFCAPGYAALGHPEWIFPSTWTTPSKKDILTAFGPAVDVLAKSMPEYTRKPSTDAESQRRLARQMSESICNKCAAELLIGTKSDWIQRDLRSFPGDKVDEVEYARVVRLYNKTCATIMSGTALAKEKESGYE
jgi:hypothetical protein